MNNMNVVIQALILPDIGFTKNKPSLCLVQKAIHSFRKDFDVLK